MTLVGPLQFWSWLRVKSRLAHRVAGYVYVGSEAVCLVFILATFPGKIMQVVGGPYFANPVGPRFLVDSFLHWLLEATTLVAAFWRIFRHKDIFWHRILMMYNYAGMLAVPLWWAWYFLLGRASNLSPEVVNELMPNQFQLMFLTCGVVTVLVLVELNAGRQQKAAGYAQLNT